eukprot:jgi/Botrbrau1/14843/Bobra.0278s0013.1
MHVDNGKELRKGRKDKKHGKREKEEKGGEVLDVTYYPHPLALGAVVAAGLYGTLQAGIKAFQLARRRYLRRMMLDICPALDQLGYDHWVDFGSLLGIYRDGDLILHDNDVDICVLLEAPEDMDGLLSGLKKALPYPVSIASPSEDPTVKWIRVWCPFGFVDVYGAYDRGKTHLEVELGHANLCDIPKHLVLPTGKLLFKGVHLSVPVRVEDVLQDRYGATWNVPRYMDKGSDTVEQNKLYARIFRTLSRAGIRL